MTVHFGALIRLTTALPTSFWAARLNRSVGANVPTCIGGVSSRSPRLGLERASVLELAKASALASALMPPAMSEPLSLPQAVRQRVASRAAAQVSRLIVNSIENAGLAK